MADVGEIRSNLMIKEEADDFDEDTTTSTSSDDLHVDEDGIVGEGCSCCDADGVDDYDYDYDFPRSEIEQEILSSEKAKHWVELVGLCTPAFYVELKGRPRIAYPLVNGFPLPQELYDEHKCLSAFSHLSKEEYDNEIRSLALGEVALGYEELCEDVQAKLAKIALAYLEEDVEYKYVRCIKTRGKVAPCIGIHIIFVAHQQDDISTGALFSAHLYTVCDPPVVCECQILCDIDTESIFEGEPRHNNVRAPLKAKDIACRACAWGIKMDKHIRKIGLSS